MINQSLVTLLLLGSLPLTSCKPIQPAASSLGMVSSPEDQIRTKYCASSQATQLSREAIYTIGDTSILSISGSVCDDDKKRLSLTDRPTHKTVVITGEPGSLAEDQQELVNMYKKADPDTVVVDLGKLPAGSDKAVVEKHIAQRVSPHFPNGYTGDLDVIYNGHGGRPSDYKPAAGGDQVTDHQTYPTNKVSDIPTSAILNAAAQGARGGRERTGKTVAVVNSCFGGQNKAFVENSASAAAECQRQEFDGIVYPVSAQQPLLSSNMIALNKEYIALRKSGYLPQYDSDKDGRITLNEFQRVVQPKTGVAAHQSMFDRAAMGFAAYVFLEKERRDLSMDAAYNPQVETYNGDLVIGRRPVATGRWLWGSP